MDPESSDSDVSVDRGDDFRFTGPLTAPIPLPAPASKHALESSDAVQARLDELQRVEDHNVKKFDLLRAKRARKDDKIRRKRETQDRKWALIMEARQRRDARIEARRRREDMAFAQFDHDLEDEESNLRRRLKRLKRGLPADDSPMPGGRSISSSSMSPPGPALSTLPPPPKRHQVGPPGQPDAINPAQSRPSPQSGLAAPAKSTLPAPSYSFYRDSPSSYPRPYHHSSYSTTPSNASPTITTNGSGHGPQPSADRSHLNHLGRPASPLTRPVPSTQSPVTPATNPNPPRQIYDTRPPPPATSSGFASINAPSTSGFATINARTNATPPATHIPLSRPPNEVDNKTSSHPVEPNHFHSYPGAPNTSNSTGQTGSGAKRTPSTTHPYQMSEAFANRHHHCERVDTLNRGIWTSYGPGGTADHPTGPAVEMYLRCNHDGCSRIDWRTVHGLQCHIVKNHDQPKGTIGSLDKALEKYGVPVKEVEDFEFHHGRGTAGTMADPKNLKMKLKTKVQSFGRVGTPGSFGVDPEARPAGYRPSPAATDDSPTMSDALKRSPDLAKINGQQSRASNNETGRQSAPQTASSSPANTYMVGRPGWLGVNAPLSTPVSVEPEPKSLQGDFSSTEPSSSEQALGSQLGLSTTGSPPTPPSTVKVAPLRPQSRNIITVSEAVKNPPNQQSCAPPDEPEPSVSSTQPQPAEVKSEEEKQDGQTATEEPSNQQAKDHDIEMTGTTEDSQEKPNESRVNGATNSDKNAASAEKPTRAADSVGERSETSEVDGNAAKEASTSSARRSNVQSPTITTRSLTATTPSSARRPSRRFSGARKSLEVDGELRKPGNNENDEKEREEKDGKDEKTEKENARLEPRRSLTGRILRRGRW
ncbi:uncharacterized protein A1O5_12376 [Cladophialophora psammophila CBS 110553]|uniref:Uncharacterized protein n=1 Tax=Cladophialophora psammophila CBS 110553 TaxID=1182543 RepID=W9VQI3_9EURO|nr:uncharacterized protein A1O5_12376 [Cladophialophora psammophila CBS 110553]EXJ57818.1 hypothetical protein A1O5_12376 [Cladophialophora psammophila CBS 110553]